MSAPATCPKCGTVLPADAPGGLCPQCLLAAGLANQSQASAAEEPMSTTDRSGAGRFVPPAPAELAAAFPQLEILELIGSGGMGAVYKARQPHLDRLVALKILPPQLAQDPAFEARFSREARTLARLSHPHIVAVYDFGTTQLPTTPATDRTPAQESRPLYYFLMEYVDGTNLRQLLRQGQLQPQQALTIVPQICEALQYAHDQGVVHRDIKPENILLDRQGRVKVADFGLAKIAGPSPHPLSPRQRGAEGGAREFTLTATGQVMGTPHYMAPEQLRGTHDVDHRADIYSLGVVFYEMLTGELPLGKFAPPSRKVQVDVRLDEVVLRALENEPERRYQQANQVRTEVETITCSSSPPGHPATSPPCLTAEEKELIEAARRQVRWPAFALTVVGCLGPGLGVAIVLSIAFISRKFGLGLREILPLLLMESVLGLFLIVSAGRMRALESYWLALVGPILAVFPCLSPFYVLRLPIGLWALVVLTKASVRAGFKQVERLAEAPIRKLSSADPASAPLAPVPPTQQFPLILGCAIGMVLGGLSMAAGVALAVYAFLSVPSGSGEFWGWLGGAFGCFFGGAGSLIGSWNSYRQVTGVGDLLRLPHRTWLDYLLWAYTLSGAGLLTAALVALFLRRALTPTVYALLLFSGIVLLQGVLFLVFRKLNAAAKTR